MGLKPDIRVRVECKELTTFEEALRATCEKERKQGKMTLMRYEAPSSPNLPDTAHHVTMVEPPKSESKKEESLKEESMSG